MQKYYLHLSTCVCYLEEGFYIFCIEEPNKYCMAYIFYWTFPMFFVFSWLIRKWSPFKDKIIKRGDPFFYSHNKAQDSNQIKTYLYTMLTLLVGTMRKYNITCWNLLVSVMIPERL